MALIAAVAPMVTNPAIKTVYNATIASFPSAFLLLVASMYAASTVLCFVLWVSRNDIKRHEVKDEEEHEEMKELRDENANAVEKSC